jgi:hypothetical protein
MARRTFTNPQTRVTFLLLAGLLIFSVLILSASSVGRAKAVGLSNAPEPTAFQPQAAMTGQWVAQFDATRPSVISMMFTRHADADSSFMTTDTISRDELQGFPADSNSAARVNVTFRIVREAGTFDCEGYFGAGKGAGFWTFTPSQGFIAAMRARGYTNLTREELLKAALHNLTTRFIEDLKAAGYDRLDFHELLRAKSHEVTAAYIREMQTAGYPGLEMDELIRARNHDIDSQYVKEVQAMGFERQTLESLIRLRNHDITQEFINRMRSAGFDNLSIEELIRLRNHDITPEFINDLKAEGYSNVSAEEAIRLKNHDIDREFIRRAKARGFTHATLEQLIRLRNNDIIK